MAGKWISSISAKQSLRKAALRTLDVRLDAVAHWLPCAASRSDEDVEFVHQLRVSSRRAVEALRVFSGLISRDICQDMRARLQQLREAAGPARDMDVMSDHFQRYCHLLDDDLVEKITCQIQHRRAQAQQAIQTAYSELPVVQFDQLVQRLLDEVRSNRSRKARRPFRLSASRYLKPATKKFFDAFQQVDLSAARSLHRLRIRSKQLRYTIEIVEGAFPASLRRQLYPRIIAIQDLLGMANDHAVAVELFGEWARTCDDRQLSTFLQGMQFSEAKGCENLRQVFSTTWSSVAVARLRRQFRRQCGL